jgi:hypothetical protein
MPTGPLPQRLLREQVRTALREPNERPAFMQFEPAKRNRTTETCGVFCRCLLVIEQERAADLLDINPAILNRLEVSHMLNEPPRGFVRISEGTDRDLLAAIHRGIFERGPIALLAPFLKIGLDAFR